MVATGRLFSKSDKKFILKFDERNLFNFKRNYVVWEGQGKEVEPPKKTVTPSVQIFNKMINTYVSTQVV